MKKTMIYLEEEQFLLLRKRAQAEERSMAELIREAVSRYLKGDSSKDDFFSFVGIGEGPKGEAASEEAEELIKQLFSKRTAS
ncbi:MAG: ribbon-helix-helix domain-containing protein [Candidatus Bipolaricaulota bacterium]|nr:ribbon-helix-helix domain-containing protein [Candidatus Bipolaricaulota bacterium]